MKTLLVILSRRLFLAIVTLQRKKMSHPPISTYKHAPLLVLTTQLPRNGNVVYAPEADMGRLSLDAVPWRAPYDLLQRNSRKDRVSLGENLFVSKNVLVFNKEVH